MQKSKQYVGLDKDLNGGMTDTGKIIREAQIFGLIPESETCEGWMAHDIEALWEKVHAAWQPYGFKVASLPEDLQSRFMRIQNEAIKRAKHAGWSAENDFASDT